MWASADRSHFAFLIYLSRPHLRRLRSRCIPFLLYVHLLDVVVVLVDDDVLFGLFALFPEHCVCRVGLGVQGEIGVSALFLLDVKENLRGWHDAREW